MHYFFLASAFLCITAASAAVSDTDTVLAKMDEAAPKFAGMFADLTRVSYTKVIDDKAVESGTILLRKQGPRSMQVLIDFKKPDPKMVAFGGSKAEIYYPKLEVVQEYDLGKRSDLVEQFTLAGFGTTGKELKANYEVRYVGEETVAGQKAHRLELVPLSKSRKENYEKLELWVAENGAYPVQQKLIRPSGDYELFTYSNVKLNPSIGDDALKLKLPKGVKREHPQK
jgi:outer membrane lipoprotein-sorting protein